MRRTLNFESLETRAMLTTMVAPPVADSPPLEEACEVSEPVSTVGNQQGMPTAADLKAQSEASTARMKATTSQQVLLLVKIMAVQDNINALKAKMDTLLAPVVHRPDVRAGDVQMALGDAEYTKGTIKERVATISFTDAEKKYAEGDKLWAQGKFAEASAKYIIAKANYDLAAKDYDIGALYYAKASVYFVKAAYFYNRALSL